MRASPRATQLLPLLLSLLLPRATCVAAAPLLNKGGGDCKRLVSAWLHAHDDDLVAGRTAAPAVRAPSLPPMASLTRPRHPPPPRIAGRCTMEPPVCGEHMHATVRLARPSMPHRASSGFGSGSPRLCPPLPPTQCGGVLDECHRDVCMYMARRGGHTTGAAECERGRPGVLHARAAHGRPHAQLVLLLRINTTKPQVPQELRRPEAPRCDMHLTEPRARVWKAVQKRSNRRWFLDRDWGH
jgi:hypothetical protein